ncbi:hypothetical protein BZA05DRAFT_157859 [Tricharina praecox]|uniref:uncharacterized protein n=1 Tax=Tricharina praecox TaxID=43433 RepID=UPI00222103E0|nr:uncharacterized protein BZA05DRAFT_157859 [Tricharina praecox]KAI5844793.1 hypothetical protein BZA05DRAFT_157859 [Tricharina praecox]
MAPDQTKDKDSAGTGTVGAVAVAVPPKREPFFDTVRRISDYQISTLLHSLIGLPSSLSPPQNSGWLDDSDLTAVDGRDEMLPRPKTVRSGSDSIVDEVRKLRDDEERKGGSGSGSGGMGIGPAISRAATSTGASAAAAGNSGGGGGGGGDSAKREMAMLPESFFVPSPASMLRGFEELHKELFRPFLADRSYSASAPAGSSSATTTELDYYKFFDQQYRYPPSGGGGGGGGGGASEGKIVVERVSEVRSATGSDGVTRTTQIEVKRYSDGTEERREMQKSILPRDGGGGGERIREITE